jgi:hypothetical protein
MPFFRRCAATFAVLLAGAGTLAAQNTVQGSPEGEPRLASVPAPAPALAAERAPVTAPSPAGQAVSFAPFTANATVGVHSKSSDAPAPYVPPRADRQTQGVTLMIIGGAALLGGAIIAGSSNAAGTLIMVGGVVCGAIGLYKYLQ